MLKCEGKGGVISDSIHPESLEKLRNLEKGIYKFKTTMESITFCLRVSPFLILFSLLFIVVILLLSLR